MTTHPITAGCGGAGGEAAVRFGAVLAAAVGEPLVIAAAYPYRPAALSARALPDTRTVAAEDEAAARLDSAVAAVPDGIEVLDHVIAATRVSESLADAAHKHDASMMVVGRDAGGEVARELVQHARCPVVVTPSDVADRPLRTIGVAYDGVGLAERAVTAAMHLGIAAGSEVRIIAVTPPGTPPDAEAARAAAVIGEAVPAAAVTLKGPAVDTLLTATRDLDLLICASHGRGRVTARVLGSVSRRLIAEAACPVMVIPPRVWHRAGRPLGLSTAAI